MSPAVLTVRVLLAVGGWLMPGFAQSAELLVLTSGFTVEAQSHSTHGGVVTANVGTGTMQLAASDIVQIIAEGAVREQTRFTGTDSAIGAGEPTPEAALRQAAFAQGLDYAFVRSVASVESALRTAAVSPKGALGLMQLMPATAADLHVNPLKTSENASGGAAYLRQLLIAYRGDSGLALAAYNAGPGAVRKYSGIPPYLETRRYIARVIQEYNHQRSLAPDAAVAPARLRAANR